MDRVDPAGAHYFALELDGVEVAHFRGCSGLRTRAEVFEIEEGGLNDRVHRFVGESRYDPVTLEVATSVSPALFDWRDACRRGDHGARRSGAITLYDLSGEPLKRYHLVGLWPVSWEGAALDAEGSELAVETLELAHEGLSLA